MAFEVCSNCSKLGKKEIALLSESRRDMLSLLNDYEDEIPFEIVSSPSPCEHKCRMGWFTMVRGKASLLRRAMMERNIYFLELQQIIQDLAKFIDLVAFRNDVAKSFNAIYLTTDNDIMQTNELIRQLVSEIESIISDEYIDQD